MQKISRRKLAEYIADQLKAGASVKKLVAHVIAYLQEERQIQQWELLLRDVEDILATKYGVVSTHMTTARPADDHTRSQLVDFIKRAEQASSVIITSETIDEDMIGGVVVYTPSNTFDSSVRSKLKQLVATTKL